MKIIKATDFNIMPEHDVSEELEKLFSHLSEVEGAKTLIFEKGTYFVNSAGCKERMLFITNTVGDREFGKGETPHLNKAMFYLNGVSDLVVEGNGACFVIDGKLTNMALENCINVTLKNIEIRHLHPDMHEMRVIDKTSHWVDFELDSDTFFEVSKGKLYFYATDYRVRADAFASTAYWPARIEEETPDSVLRVKHPLFAVRKVEKLSDRSIRAYVMSSKRYNVGDRFYVFDNRRQFAGIFINKCSDITLYGIKQRFNYSLAVVAQDCENMLIDSVEFAPEQNSVRKLSSVADFIQLCMCRGKITVKNSFFDGAGDDCLNVHGIHFKVKSVKGNTITVKFKHPQTHGFNSLRVGDSVAFIDRNSLLEKGRAVITASELADEYTIKLDLSTTKNLSTGMVIEDVSACPDFEFANNMATRIITRGLLITTRGNVDIHDNRFKSTGMSGILLSDDAWSWYESGMCCDVKLRNNVFDYCKQTPILIKPENRCHKGAVHKNITITENTFSSYSGVCISAKSTDRIYIKGNKFLDDNFIKTKNCTNVKID